ncbi:MAG: hypothetical protein M3M99_02205 [Actinomycetota bacterium]|nr:hypothetical protein [Actinomycetota bacterium]
MSEWWLIGFVIGVLVVLLLGSLILYVTAVANKVAGDIDELNVALEGTSRKTRALHQLSSTNDAVVRITAGLFAVRGGSS